MMARRVSRRFFVRVGALALGAATPLLAACGATPPAPTVAPPSTNAPATTTPPPVAASQPTVAPAGTVASRPLSAASTASAATTGSAAPSGILQVSMGALPSSCDPQKTAAGISYTVFYNLYDGLTEVDDRGNLLPKLATAWKQLDVKGLQLTLRQGVQFHNGEPFNAQVVKYNFDRNLDPSFPSAIRSWGRTRSGAKS